MYEGKTLEESVFVDKHFHFEDVHFKVWNSFALRSLRLSAGTETALFAGTASEVHKEGWLTAWKRQANFRRQAVEKEVAEVVAMTEKAVRP